MSEITTTNGQKATTPARGFRNAVSGIATSLLREWVGDERASEAVGRLSSALAASAASARKPDDFYACTPASIAQVIATSALTGIMPGTGATALAYAIPRRPRRGEPPQLTFQLSHRGCNSLARRCGQIMIAVPVGQEDMIDVINGEVVNLRPDIDHPPMAFDDLRGVCVIVKNVDTGVTIFTGWVSSVVIERRREGSDAYQYAKSHEYAQATDPWHAWPVEMAMKTAMHYAISRGWCVIDDTESCRALSMDSDSQLALPASDQRRIGSKLYPSESFEQKDSTPVGFVGHVGDVDTLQYDAFAQCNTKAQIASKESELLKACQTDEERMDIEFEAEQRRKEIAKK